MLLLSTVLAGIGGSGSNFLVEDLERMEEYFELFWPRGY